MGSEGLNEAELAGAEGGLGAIEGAERGEDVRHVVFDRALGNIEPGADLLVAATAGEETEEIELAGGERIGERWARWERGRDGGRAVEAGHELGGDAGLEDGRALGG